MRAVVGTVPFEDFPLTVGKAALSGQDLRIGGHTVPVNRGTPALLAATIRALETIGSGEVTGFLVGDIGLGNGSRRLYEMLVRDLSGYDLESLTFHYLQPDVDWHNRVRFAVDEMPRRPLLIADAGFMYAAKMSGSALVFATIGRLAQSAALPLFSVVLPESVPWLGIKLLIIFRHKSSS
jgi:hypothetical protein